MKKEELSDLLKTLSKEQINFCIDWIEKNKNKEYCIKSGKCTICNDNVGRDDDGNHCDLCGWKICENCIDDDVDKEWKDYYCCKDCYENKYEICSRGHEKEKNKSCKDCQYESFSSQNMDLIELAANDILAKLDCEYELEKNKNK